MISAISADRSSLQRYGFAALFLIAAFVLRLEVDPLTGARANWTPFYLVAILSALFGGTGPALVAIAVSVFGVDYWFIEPRESLAITTLSDQVVAASFCFVSLILAGIGTLARGVIRDLSAARIEQSHLASIVSSSDDAIVGKDLGGVIRSWNAGAERLFGYSAAETVGRNISMLLPPHRRDDVNAILAQVGRGERVDHYETERLRKDGRQITVSLTVSPIRDTNGVVIGAAKIARDITSRREIEAEQARLIHALRDADRRKDEFLAMLAHELRNPLGPIRNGVDVLQMIGPQDPKVARAVAMVQRQVAHLTRLVDDLLDVSRITHGNVSLQRQLVDLGEIIDHAIDQTRAAIEAKSQHLRLGAAPIRITLDADPARMIQIVANLIGNASKFTPRGGEIRVVTALDDAGGVIRVIDTGIGIPADLLPRVFDLFVQGSTSLDRTQGGLGIGLTLARQLVALHGGRIEAHSAGTGHGSEFVIRLPAAASAPLARTESSGAGEQTPHRRVLLVEDNRDAADSFKMLLELNGHTVQLAANGHDALALVDDGFSPDVAFVDIGLPGMDGFEVATRLRAHPSSRSSVLVALSGYGTDGDQRRSTDAGFDCHLVKPVDFGDVTRLLADLDSRVPTVRNARALH